ncbi:RluA family pseudouridine synthase [Mycoplasma sp. CSL10137]|uniref:RluA family pseudouridine synthase n=1 Tax=unclassified Mycoplasma TaxID=2683645 RepID=UPI00197B35C6|nr:MULTISPECIES: RluA family pseudouridine synthase [unclassified Mycoplasma]MBN4083775.1 RluA family pseudouridine synthase [Mycoplasma sp. CSL10137]MBN4084179.1 RluA family pseudouridine synthase [Mycoplasma sp. CSL10166]
MIELKVEYKERIDKYISNNTNISRNDIKILIDEHAILVDDVAINKPKFVVREDQVIKIMKVIDKEINIEPEQMELDIVYDDEYISVIDKPSGLVVHPSPGHPNGTLVNGLLYHFKNNLSNESGVLRPGIVHRIDKDTSGLLIIAKNNQVHQLLAEKFANHEINRKYIAICDGIIENKKLKLDLPIGRSANDRQKMAITNTNSKHAITWVEKLSTFYIDKMPKTLVKCELETGRTHQIRVHLKYIGNPIYGDPVYGKKVDDFGQRLHAYKLEFMHPITQKKIELFSKTPKEFNASSFDFDEFLKSERTL